MSHRKTDLGIPRRSKSAKVVLVRCQCEYDQQAVKEDRMAKFLAFKDYRGQEIYVNAALVRAVRSEGESGAWIDFDGQHSIRTPSPANAVVRDLERAV